MKVTLIVSTYNRPDALVLCLESIFRQTVLPGEIIIGDDGSKQETVDVIREYQKKSPVPLIHIWQEDNGFQLAKARNKCIARACYEYIVQVDGDLVLHEHFIEDHLLFAERGYYVKGGRVNIDNRLTTRLCSERRYVRLGFFSRGLMRRINAIHCLPLARYLAVRRKTAPGLGCNMGFWREDAIKVNGYDEFYVGWGGEDYDFAIRMLHSGLQKKSLKFAGIVFHLWHNDLYMDNQDKNFSYYHAVENSASTWCEKGVAQYL